jgi:hypothetical protein
MTHEWTTATLKELITTVMDERDRRYEQRWLAADTAVQAAFAAAEKANQRSEAAQQNHNAQANAYREQLREQAATMLPRELFERAHHRLEQDIDELRTFVSESTGRLSQSQRSEDISLTRLGIFLLSALSFISIALSLYATFH